MDKLSAALGKQPIMPQTNEQMNINAPTSNNNTPVINLQPATLILEPNTNSTNLDISYETNTMGNTEDLGE